MNMITSNFQEIPPPNLVRSRHVMIGTTLLIALFAFEIFNFDTTKYALSSLLGDISFIGIKWAAILAIAFCAIDFAGLARIFTPQTQMGEEPKEVWYLMGAWLLGATMNAIMTWWAVSLTLLENPVGNAILSAETLLKVVPIFVAILVWLTRILFIGSLSITGDHLFNPQPQPAQRSPQIIEAKPTARRETESPVEAATIRVNPAGRSNRERDDESERVVFESGPTQQLVKKREAKPRANVPGRPQRAINRPKPPSTTVKSYDN